MNIKKELRKELIKESTGHDYGCVMLYLPIEKEWWDGITKGIKEDDVYSPEGERDYGIQPPNEIHVTILYGLHADIPDEDIENFIDNMTAPEVTLDKVSIFDNADKGFDVLKFDVEGKELFKMNKDFAKMPHTTDYPDYHPHVTIAYLKAGTGQDYADKMNKAGKSLKPTKIVYSKADGSKKEYTID